MKISSITVQNFRCFGEIPETIDLSLDLTAFVGSNGSGKTAVMMALNRMFGATQSQRTIRRTDFHQRFGMNVDEQRSNYLAIEVKVVFPELEMDTPNAEAIPSVFNQMLVEAPGGELFNRLRLEAQWTNDGTSEGHVEQKLFWVTSLNDPVPNDKKKPLSPYHRGLIQVIYVPATRDPGPEIRNVARSRIGRLLNAISWDSETRDAMQAASLQMSNVLNQEAPVVLFNDFLQGRWDRLRDDYGISEAELRFVASDFQSVIRDFGITFKSQEHGIESDLSRLSEGQLSLFYLALVAAVFDVERQIISQSTPTIVDQIAIGTVEDEKPVGETNESNTNHGFKLDRFHTPALTVFAIEEPENHLAPHYLSRITDLLRSFTSTGAAQAVFSSHSASILRRIAPDEIRHLRLDSDRRAHATELSLPENEDEIGNFVRQAVTAYPELYFGKLVILAEGPSEEVVIPKFASAFGLEIDQSFVCVVPLGGRHVNHFWKLLKDLQIPFVTLLDLDIGRQTGGWARIKYVCDQLLAHDVSIDEILSAESDELPHVTAIDDLESLHLNRSIDLDEFKIWAKTLEHFNVYFSGPLDLDFTMLWTYPDAYKHFEGQTGPSIPDEGSDDWRPYMVKAIASIVGDNKEIVDMYLGLDRDVVEGFPWYRYLFSNRSKPVSHMIATARINDQELAKKVPGSLNRLVSRCKTLLAEAS